MNKFCKDYITEIENFIELSEEHHKTTKLFLMVLWAFQVFNIFYVGVIEYELDFMLLIVINTIIIYFGQKQYLEEDTMLNKMKCDFFVYKYAKVLNFIDFNRINNQE